MDDNDLLGLQERAQLSDEFKELTRSRGYALLEQHILEKLYQQAFDTFKKVDPESTTQVIQSQMMGKMIDRIRLEVNRIIDDGDMARQLLRDINSEA